MRAGKQERLFANLASALSVILLACSLPAQSSELDIKTQLIAGVDDVPLNVIEVGSRELPTIIFIHGLSQSHLSWEKQFVAELADEFHLVTYDLRGHGNSGKPWLAEDYAAPEVWAGDLEKVIQATEARRPLLVAWSYGTWVAVDYLSSKGTTSIEGLVLVGALGGLTPPRPNPRPGDAEKGEQIRARIGSGLLKDNFAVGEDIADFFIAKPVQGERWMRNSAAANALLPPYARPLILQRSFDHSAAVKDISLPTLLLLGSLDPQVREEDARQLASELPRAAVSVFEGSGHLPFVEDAQRFNNEIRAFARQSLNAE